jgi:Rho-binding antiterminator
VSDYLDIIDTYSQNPKREKIMSDCTPASCELYDRLEAIATLNEECRLTYFDGSKLTEVQGKIVDVYAADNADWCKLNDNTVIRLDKIESFATK